MTRALVAGIAMLFVAWASPAVAQEACKMEQLKDPKLSLGDMYARAEARAKAWKPDVVPVSISNTTLGPLDEQGRSEAWSLNFYSKTANAYVSITTFRGMFNCYAQPGNAGRIPDLKPDFFRDGAKLYGIGKQHGAALLAQGHFIMLATAAAPDTRHATWYINFSKPDSTSGNVTIIVDANTGALEKVLK